MMIEAEDFAYADLLHDVGDPRFSKIPVPEMISRDVGRDGRSSSIPTGLVQRQCLRHSTLNHEDAGNKYDLSVRCWIVTEQYDEVFSKLFCLGLRSGVVPAGTEFVLRGPGRPASPSKRDTLMRCGASRRPFDAILPGFMSKERYEDSLRHYGKIEPNAGPRAVRIPTSSMSG